MPELKTKTRIARAIKAIEAVERCGVKPHIRLVRYHRVLEHLERWEQKLTRAETMEKKYRNQARYYERWMNFDDD